MGDFDIKWENTVYCQKKQLNIAPYSNVVSFLFSNLPNGVSYVNIEILEVGCGAGNNLLFFSELGFKTYGIDGSKSAIEFADKRKQDKGLTTEFKVGDFSSLPYENESMDFVIDRGAITHNRLTGINETLAEIRRVLRPNGKFFSYGFLEEHPEIFNTEAVEDGASVFFKAGYFKDISQVFFFSDKDIINLYGNHFKICGLTKNIDYNVIDEHKISAAGFTAICSKK